MLRHMLHVSSSSQVTCDLAFIHTMYTDNMCMADTNVPVPFKALCLGLPAKRCTGGDNSSWRQGWRRQRAPCSITSRSCMKMCVCVCVCVRARVYGCVSACMLMVCVCLQYKSIGQEVFTMRLSRGKCTSLDREEEARGSRKWSRGQGERCAHQPREGRVEECAGRGREEEVVVVEVVVVVVEEDAASCSRLSECETSWVCREGGVEIPPPRRVLFSSTIPRTTPVN